MRMLPTFTSPHWAVHSACFKMDLFYTIVYAMTHTPLRAPKHGHHPCGVIAMGMAWHVCCFATTAGACLC